MFSAMESSAVGKAAHNVEGNYERRDTKHVMEPKQMYISVPKMLGHRNILGGTLQQTRRRKLCQISVPDFFSLIKKFSHLAHDFI